MNEKIDTGGRPRVTLEIAIRNAFREGRERELIPVLEFMLPEKKEWFRKIWQEELDKRKAASEKKETKTIDEETIRDEGSTERSYCHPGEEFEPGALG